MEGGRRRPGVHFDRAALAALAWREAGDAPGLVFALALTTALHGERIRDLSVADIAALRTLDRSRCFLITRWLMQAVLARQESESESD